MSSTKGDHLRTVMSETEWDRLVKLLHVAADEYDSRAQTNRQILNELSDSEPEHALITARGARQLAEINEDQAAKARQFAADLCTWLAEDNGSA